MVLLRSGAAALPPSYKVAKEMESHNAAKHSFDVPVYRYNFWVQTGFPQEPPSININSITYPHDDFFLAAGWGRGALG